MRKNNLMINFPEEFSSEDNPASYYCQDVTKKLLQKYKPKKVKISIETINSQNKPEYGFSYYE